MKEAGQWVSEVAVTGGPYQEGDLWYVAVEIRSKTGQSEKQNAMIKFYELKGKTHCFIIGSKEGNDNTAGRISDIAFPRTISGVA